MSEDAHNPCDKSEPPVPPQYKIKTLRDIFALPTPESMERCLRELTDIMISARATADLMIIHARKFAEAQGKELPENAVGFHWPEEATWTDDGGLVNSKVSIAHDGETLVELRVEAAKN